jgi:hypothetical protein
MPTVEELKQQLKELKKTHKDIRITGLTKQQLSALVDKYSKVPEQKGEKKVIEKKEKVIEKKEKVAYQPRSQLVERISELEHTLGMIIKVAEKKRKEKERIKKLKSFKTLLTKVVSAKRVVKFIKKIEGDIINKRDYQHLVFE